MSTANPIAKSSRQSAIVTATAGQTVFSGAGFKVWDVADVEVWRLLAGQSWTKLTSGYTVAKTQAAAFSDFTVTLAAGALAGTKFRFISRRVHERISDISLGAAISGEKLEGELDRMATVLQEAARDAASAVRLSPEGDAADFNGARLRNLGAAVDASDALTKAALDAFVGGEFVATAQAAATATAASAAAAQTSAAAAAAAQQAAEDARDVTLATTLPPGGTTRQALVKKTAADRDTEWATLREVPATGTTGHVLTKTVGGFEFAALPALVTTVNGKAPVAGNVDVGLRKLFATRSSAQSIPNVTYTNILWNDAEFDPLSMVSAGDNADIVIPSGVSEIDLECQINWNTTLGNNTQLRFGHYQSDGVTLRQPFAYNLQNNTGATYMRFVTLGVAVVAGDIINMAVYQNSGAARSLVADNTYLRIKVNK